MKHYKLSFITSDEMGCWSYQPSQVVSVDSQGLITSITPVEQFSGEFQDFSEYLTIPVFSDLHLHAAQVEIAGLGYDLPLSDWFEKVIYPTEKAYDQADNYMRLNQQLVQSLWRYGILNASVFAAPGAPATLDLIKQMAQANLRGFVGKMNADVTMQNERVKTVAEELNATEQLIKASKVYQANIKYALSPEFIPTCSAELLAGLGNLQKQYDLVVQSHFAEGDFDYEIVKQRFPHESYVEVYQKYGLLPKNKTLLIHGVMASELDLKLIKNSNNYFVHCPTALSDNPSNKNVAIKPLLKQGIKLGYGSDIGGSGTLNSWQNAVALTRYANTINVMTNDNSINIWDSLDLITRINGQFFGNYGMIALGQQFSVLLIDDRVWQSNQPLKLDRILRFVYRGESSQIMARYQDGQLLTKIT